MEIKGLVKEIVDCHDHNEHYLLLNGAEVAQTISNDLYEEKSILFIHFVSRPELCSVGSANDSDKYHYYHPNNQFYLKAPKSRNQTK